VNNVVQRHYYDLALTPAPSNKLNLSLCHKRKNQPKKIIQSYAASDLARKIMQLLMAPARLKNTVKFS
jgi:hypothetical protein